MNYRGLTVKDLRLAVKKHVTISSLLEQFGFETEEELFSVIRDIDRDYERTIKALKKAEKQIRESSKAKIHVDYCIESKVATDTSLKESDLNDESESKLEVVETETFESLSEEEAAWSSTCIHMENTHESYRKRRREIVDSLQEEKDALSNLLIQLEERQNKVINLSAEYETLATQMSELSSDIADCKKVLQEIRSKIEIIQSKISISSEGTIEGVIIKSLPDVDITPVVNQLISLPTAEDLTIKQLRTVAKLITWKKFGFFEKAQLEFEDDKMKAVFEAE